MKINSLNGNYNNFLGKNTNTSVSFLKVSITSSKNSSTKETTELSPEFKKKLQLLDKIKADKQNLWENISNHFGYMIGFAGLVKEGIEDSIKYLDILMDENSSVTDKHIAQSSLDGAVRMIDCFSKEVSELYNECNYITDGKLQEVTNKYTQETDSNNSLDRRS